MAIYKNQENGTYYMRFRNKTKRGFRTKEEAEIYEAKLKLGLMQVVDLKGAINDYLALLETTHKNSSLTREKGILNNIVIPNFPNKTIDLYSSKDFRTFRDKISKMEYSTMYKNDILEILRKVFKHCCIYYGLPNDPSVHLKALSKTVNEKIKEREKVDLVWTLEDFQSFIKCVKEYEYQVLFTVLFFTGLRISEALALTWNDLSSDHILKITKSLTYKNPEIGYAFTTTKTPCSVRDIDVGNNLYEYLMKYKKAELLKPGFKDKWFIFGGTKPLAQTTINRRKTKAASEAGVKNITLHQIRHSHATFLIENGVNIEAVTKRMGHMDCYVTLKVYAHALSKHEKMTSQFIDEFGKDFFNEG